MPGMMQDSQYLLTLPPAMAAGFAQLEKRYPPQWFAASDPEGYPLGSGGGTANLLVLAWQATGNQLSFQDWITANRKLIMHAGGQSRRLPAYAPVGKLLMPIPVFRWSRGQRLDQTLLDLQLPAYERVLAQAPAGARVMLTSGDVLLRFPTQLPPLPDVDVLGLGMWVAPETAEHFGVFFLPRSTPDELEFFLQKPRAARIRELAAEHLCLVDTGMWLLSERAIGVLMKRCGWSPEEQRFSSAFPRNYEFYGEFALALGKCPTLHDPEINALSCAAVPLPDAQFFHFGTSRQIIESVAELQNLVLDETKVAHQSARQRPDQVTQNSYFPIALHRDGNEMLWIENSVLAENWELGSEHVLTGIPPNDWRLKLASGTCLDIVPVGETDLCIRFYHIDDTFLGKVGAAGTRWMGEEAVLWFRERGLGLADCGLHPDQEMQSAALFPVIAPTHLAESLVQWLIHPPKQHNPELGKLWRESPRLSAQGLLQAANLRRVYCQRDQLRAACLPTLIKNFRRSVFSQLDFDATARVFATSCEPVPELACGEDEHMAKVHGAIFRSAVARHRGESEWRHYEQDAFAALREMIRRQAQLSPALPLCSVHADQIVWARSPVRLDLAGGWTDTPPYCIEHGGKVLNLAVDLNGQPPVQVYARLSERHELVMRSIDLGLEGRVRTYSELDTSREPHAPFALAKAAFALAGFLPAFHKDGGFGSLAEQLKAFGSGIELSFVCAVPKGSGLGTSSILSVTILAALSDLCGLGWDRNVLFSRTLALEQMLTTGGGWQDQAGALFRGIKVVETSPGLAQRPRIRWLPPHMFEHEYANRTILLYYTGLTRLAKNILEEIVRGMFLNSPRLLSVLAEIGAEAEATASAVQACDYSLLQQCVQRSWVLNQRLDSGTNPPAVQAILEPVHDYLGAAKLLGAGGGGYLLMLAKDESAGLRIRRALQSNPPNKKARFVDLSVSDTGLQVTRS